MISRSWAPVRKMWRKVGLRARLEAFILLAILPLAGLVFFLVLQERSQEIERARQNMVVLAERGASQHAETLRQAHSVLQMLTLVPEVRMALPQECGKLLQQTTAVTPWSTGFSVVHPNGQLLCDSDGRQLSIADRDYFRRALASREFTVSNYIIGRASGKPVLIALLPMLDDVGEIDRILLAGIDLRWFSNLAAEAARASGAIVMLLDRQGTILARQPDHAGVIGDSIADQPTIRAILSSTAGVIDGAGLDGTARLIGYASLEASGARLIVGVAQEGVVAAVDRRVMLSTGVVVLVVLLLVGGVWIVMEVSVLRGLRDLHASATRMASEHFDPRHPCAPSGGQMGEIGEVARAVRSMGRKLHTAAHQDRLTGLANRRAFEGYLAHLKAEPELTGGAVLYIDLDGFKPVNDQHGHHVGDAVLEEVGARLAACVDDGGMAARVGGDEFVVIINVPDGQGGRVAKELALRIIKAVAKRFTVEDKQIRIGCSIGIAVWGTGMPDLDCTLQQADQALYGAKRCGRGRAVMFGDADAAAQPPRRSAGITR